MDQLELFDLTSLCQRWRRRVPTWRPAAEGGFDARRYTTAPVDAPTARGFVTRHHYSRAFPAAAMRMGMFDRERLVGVAVLGVPMSRQVLAGPFPTLEPYRQALELSRLVLLDDVPSNGESWFVRRVFTHAAALGVRGVVAFSDPMPRLVGGRVLMPGHIGTVYQALNSRYTGRGTARTLTVLPDGQVFSARSRAKITGGEAGADGVRARLITAGAPAPDPGEHPARWLRRALTCIGARTVRHQGNHRYVWAIGDRGARRRTPIALEALPYPTRIDGAR